ncbi:hypothetical protein WJN01_07880 [Flavobacteriaceae bacterium SZ-1-7]|uniref:hypothetical protein n=1 Tax=Tamlana sedimenti TaxID=3134126 RepID=UPI0031277B69
MGKKPKKTLKIIAGVIIFLTLPSLLFFGFLYIKYDEDLPTGIQGEQADALAHKMLDALDYQAFQNTNRIEWTFKERRHYEWDREKSTCDVYWKENKVVLNLNDYSKSKVYIHSFKNEGEIAKDLIKKAKKYYENDSFWLVAPYKVFDPGTERRLVKTVNGKEALLVTYTTGGSEPGDSYLWYLDENGMPTKFQMWVNILPIGGLEASWSHWTTTESGAKLPTFHSFMFFGFQIEDIKGTK